MRKELLSQKEAELDDLEISQPIQIECNTNIRRFTVEEMCSTGKDKGVAGQSSAGKIRCVTNGSNQPYQQTQEIEMELDRKDLGRSLWSNHVTPTAYTGNPHDF